MTARPMSTLDELPPDQRAALSLLLAQRKSYSGVAQLLHIADSAVRDRAHAALAVLAPAKARELSPEQRELVGDYLLGQHDVAEQVRTRTLLATTPPARAWALALSDALAALAKDGLPGVPAAEGPALADGREEQAAAAAAHVPAAAGVQGGPPEAGVTPAAEPAPLPAAEMRVAGTETPQPARQRAEAPRDDGAGAAARPRVDGGLPSSRVGGAIVLAVLLAAIVVGVVLLTGGGASKGHTGSTAAKTTVATGSGPSVSRIAMRPAEAGGHSLGLLQILQEGSKRAFYLVAEKVPPTSGFFYALWLYNSPSSAEPLGKAPAVGSSHRLEGGGALPADAGAFHEVLLTRETSVHAAHPGPVVLRGRFSLQGESTVNGGGGGEAGG
jgi:hypothetical protein